MRRIIRIIVAVLLVAIAIIVALDRFAGTHILSSLIHGKNVTSFTVGSTLTYKDGDKYIAGDASIDAKKVKNLDINWISGGITFGESTSNEVSFRETNSSATSKDDMLHWYLDGDTLRIQWCKSGIHAFNKSKNLSIHLPSGLKLDTITINAVSADVTGGDFNARTIVSNTVSSKVKFSSLSLQDSFQGNSVSGDYTLDLTTKPSSIAFSGVSGSFDLTLPKDTGFTISMDSVSGNIRSNVPTTGDKKHQTAGNGEVKISFESVSGNASVSYR